jgi:hypothetical protein
MKWLILILLATATGCSTAPLAGFLDAVKPSKPADAGRDRQLPPPMVDPTTPRP